MCCVAYFVFIAFVVLGFISVFINQQIKSISKRPILFRVGHETLTQSVTEILDRVSVDDLEKSEDLPIHSSRSGDPRIHSGPSMDPPMDSSRSAVSTGRVSSAAKHDVINFLEKVSVDARLTNIDQVYSSCT